VTFARVLATYLEKQLNRKVGFQPSSSVRSMALPTVAYAPI
jgi:hypothetical protein